tara:strand:+ start:83286 stop:84083 length:798 start_codon:yes stop_codon:yes gene_type:complete
VIKKITKLCLAGTLALGAVGTAFAADEAVDTGPFAAENFSATLTMTSNYMYRGMSFTNDKPALQGSFDWGYSNFFAGAWSSSLADQDSDGYELETDFYVGYADSVAGIDWFVMPIYYKFSSFDQKNTGGADADVFELWLDAAYAINETFSVHGMYAYSPDFFFESGDSHYVRGDVTANLPRGFSLTAGVGYQDVEGDNGNWVGAQGWDYTHWDITLAKSLAGFDLSLMYSDTDADKATDSLNANFWGGATDNTDDTVTFTVSRSF